MLRLCPADTTDLRFNHVHTSSPFLAISELAIISYTTAQFSLHFDSPFEGESTSSRNEDINFAQRQLLALSSRVEL